MKYIFKSDPHLDSTELELTNFQLVVRQQGKERVIPYSAITDVRLECKSGSFFMTLQSLDYGSVRITNRSFVADGKWDDQSRQYHTFVRVLHLHLLEVHCKAEFCSGFKPTHLATKLVLLVVLSVLVYLVEDYFHVLPLSPFLEAGAVLIVSTLFLMVPYLKNPPKHYEPSNIPLNMLPPAV
jgi:hypothetical protein